MTSSRGTASQSGRAKVVSSGATSAGSVDFAATACKAVPTNIMAFEPVRGSRKASHDQKKQ